MLLLVGSIQNKCQCLHFISFYNEILNKSKLLAILNGSIYNHRNLSENYYHSIFKGARYQGF